MPRRPKKPEGRQRNPALMLFLSLNMILLAFFILLVALSQPDKSKQAEIAVQVRRAFQSFGGAFLGLGPYLEQTGVSREQSVETVAELERYLQELSRFVEESPQSKALNFEISTEGVRIRLSNDLLFPEAGAALRPGAGPVLDRMYELILRTTNPVRIEGHTDNRPVRTPEVRDNWHLSALRAMAVFRYFTANGEIPEDRFAVAGYGSQRPVASNLTASGRQRNRRVAIVFQGPVQELGEP